MLGDRRPALLELRRQLVDRRGTGAQAIEDRPPGGIGDGTKD